MIEDVKFEIDGGYGEEPPYHVKAFLRLEGDFVEQCDAYLEDEEATGITFEISRSEAEKLQKQLTEALYG